MKSVGKLTILLVSFLLITSTCFADVYWSWDQTVRVHSGQVKTDSGFEVKRLQVCGASDSTQAHSAPNPLGENCRTYPKVHPHYFKGEAKDWQQFFAHCESFDFLNIGFDVSIALAAYILTKKGPRHFKGSQHSFWKRNPQLNKALNLIREKTMAKVPPRMQRVGHRLAENKITAFTGRTLAKGAGIYQLGSLLPSPYPRLVEQSLNDTKAMVFDTLNNSQGSRPLDREEIFASEKILEMCSFAYESHYRQAQVRECLGSCHNEPASLTTAKARKDLDEKETETPVQSPTRLSQGQGFAEEAIENYLESQP